jgi:hypothetical protein
MGIGDARAANRTLVTISRLLSHTPKITVHTTFRSYLTWS